MNNAQVQIMGIPWYKREDYDRLRTIFEDGNKLHDSYDKWLKAAENTQMSIENSGVRVIRVNIDPEEFPAWCERRSISPNAAARLTYANEAAEKSVRPS